MVFANFSVKDVACPLDFSNAGGFDSAADLESVTLPTKIKRLREFSSFSSI